MGLLIAAWVGNAAIATAFVGALAVFIPRLGADTTNGHVWAYVTAIGTIWLLTLINAWGVKQTGAVQLVTTVLKFVPLALIGIIGLFFMDTGNFGEFALNGYGTGNGMIGGITAAMALTLWAFIGLESATVPAEEVKDAERSIPRATIRGTLGTAVLYAVATIAVMGILPLTVLRDSTAPVRRRGHRDLRRNVLGEGRRPRGDDLDLRRAERLDRSIKGGSRTPRPRMTCSRGRSGSWDGTAPWSSGWSCRRS